MWERVGQGLRDVFGPDLVETRDMATVVRIALRLLLAAFLGGLLGYERTVSRRPAGLRTHMLVALGAAAYVIAAAQSGMSQGDLSRVVQGLVAGIGFLGAGAIFKSESPHHTSGLTTAAGIWLTAAVGMSVGLGRPMTGLIVAILALVILSPLKRFEDRVEAHRDSHRPPPQG